MVEYQRNELYGIRGVEWFARDIRHTEHRGADFKRQLHADLYRRRRFGVANGGGSVTARADADVHRVSGEHPIRFRIAADLVGDRCDELYRVRCLDGVACYVRHSINRCFERERELHIDLYGRRRLGFTDGRRHPVAGTDTDVCRLADERSIGFGVPAHLEHDQRDELRGVRWMERHASNFGDSDQRRVDGQQLLYADLFRHGWIDRAHGFGDGNFTCAYGDVGCLTDDRSVRQRVAAHMVVYERNIV